MPLPTVTVTFIIIIVIDNNSIFLCIGKYITLILQILRFVEC